VKRMTDLRTIIKELNESIVAFERRGDRKEADAIRLVRAPIVGFVQELQVELDIRREWQEGIVMPEQSHAEEIRILERVIGEEAKAT
jgi:hypothetical protein